MRGWRATTRKLNDVSAERIEAGLATINGNMARQVKSDRISEDQRKGALGRLTAAEGIASLNDCDLVIESAVEDEAVKREIFIELCKGLKEGSYIASNTSSISITRLAATTDRPEHFMGIHFMNPVPVMELVELVRGIATDDETFSTAKEFVSSLDKTVAVAEDFPAFMVNRILLPMINEAVYTLYEGVGTVDAIDTAMKLGANHPMGPLQLADFIGLRHLPVDHAGALRGAGGFQVPPVPAAGEVRRSRLAGAQDPTRVLRLPRRGACADKVRGAAANSLPSAHGTISSSPRLTRGSPNSWTVSAEMRGSSPRITIGCEGAAVARQALGGAAMSETIEQCRQAFV